MKLTYALPVLGALTLFAALPNQAQAGGHSSWGISVGVGYSNYGYGGGYNTGVAFNYSSGGGYYGHGHHGYYGGHRYYGHGHGGYYAPRYAYYAPAPVAYYAPAPRYGYYNSCSYNYAPVYYRPVYSPASCYRY
jgi:hypothetical protein